jgi:hypothetical protein
MYALKSPLGASSAIKRRSIMRDPARAAAVDAEWREPRAIRAISISNGRCVSPLPDGKTISVTLA